MMKTIIAAITLVVLMPALSCSPVRPVRNKEIYPDNNITTAVDNNDAAAVRSELDGGFYVNRAFTEGWTLLHLAMRWDAERISRIFFNQGNTTAIANSRAARMVDRARSDAVDIVSLLISRRASINKKTADGNTPLHIAIASLSRDAADFPSIPPVEGTISSRFGLRSSPLENNNDYHRGLDISAKNGTPVLAAADGIVIMTDISDTAGNYIVIQHQKGVQTAYGHCHLFAVGKNAWVRRGCKIGYVGRSGAVSGDHCHFEVRINDAPVDPLPYIHQKEICDVQQRIIHALVEVLLSNKADIDARNKDGRTPLIECAGKNAAISRLLADHGADVNAKDGSGITPLHAAAAFDEGLVRYLLKKEAQVNPRTIEKYCAIGGILYRSGSTPLTVALKSGKTAIADILKRHGALE